MTSGRRVTTITNKQQTARKFWQKKLGSIRKHPCKTHNTCKNPATNGYPWPWILTFPLHLKYICMAGQTHRDSGNFVKVARLLVYMCPPTSMCTGALDLVSWAGVGMPWLLKGDTGDRVIMGLDMLERLSWGSTKEMHVGRHIRL